MLNDVDKIVAVDPLTVEIHVRRKYAPLLGNLAMYPKLVGGLGEAVAMAIERA